MKLVEGPVFRGEIETWKRNDSPSEISDLKEALITDNVRYQKSCACTCRLFRPHARHIKGFEK